jgi:hypothetical protein
MAVKLHEAGRRFAQSLILEGKSVRDELDAWSEHQPSTDEENRFIEAHGIAEYGKWHLGVDNEHAADTKGHWKYPYGDFERAHRCGLLAAETRAGRNKHLDIERAAHQLHLKIEGA